MLKKKQPHTSIIKYKPKKKKPKKLEKLNKNLIISVSIARKSYYDMSQILIDSLRDIGNYNDDIIIITDNKNLKFKRAQTIYYNGPKITTKLQVFCLKITCHNLIKNLNYNKIMFCDSDVVCTSSVNKLFNLINDNSFYLVRSRYNMYLKFATKEEKRLAKKKFKLYDAGYFAGKKKVYLACTKKWNKILKQFHAAGNSAVDEEVLNHMILKNLIKYKTYPINYVESSTYLFKNRFKSNTHLTNQVCLFHIKKDKHKTTKLLLEKLYNKMNLSEILLNL